LEDYSKQHKKAWEFDAYDFWVRTAGTPEERASKDKENPRKMLKLPGEFTAIARKNGGTVWHQVLYI